MADTTIREFTVATIKKRIKVKARSPWQAAVEAVKTRRFKSIGMLIEVRDPKSTMFYVSGIKAAKAAGLLVDDFAEKADTRIRQDLFAGVPA